MKTPDPDTIKKMLIPIHTGIGDIIMFIPTLRSFKRYFRNSTLSVAARPKYKPLFRGIVDEFIPFAGIDASLKKKLLFMQEIRKSRFDMVVKPYLGSTHTIVALSNIPHRVGFSTSSDFPVPLDFIFNYKAKMDQTLHQIDRNLALFYAVGGREPTRDFSLKIEENKSEWAKNLLKKNGIEEGDFKVGIAPKSSVEWKDWGLTKFNRLADLLIEEKGAKVVLLGEKKNEEKIGNSVIDLCNKTNLIEAAAVIKECDLFISNDGGLAWLAQAVGTPVIVIYGPTDYARTHPVGPWDKIIRKELPCSPCYRTPKDYYKPKRCKERRCLSLITPGEVTREVIHSNPLSTSFLYSPFLSISCS
jgi:ADP-heptose:LPS heptosyltransferase